MDIWTSIRPQRTFPTKPGEQARMRLAAPRHFVRTQDLMPLENFQSRKIRIARTRKWGFPDPQRRPNGRKNIFTKERNFASATLPRDDLRACRRIFGNTRPGKFSAASVHRNQRPREFACMFVKADIVNWRRSSSIVLEPCTCIQPCLLPDIRRRIPRMRKRKRPVARPFPIPRTRWQPQSSSFSISSA